jgi:hypothetical protein
VRSPSSGSTPAPAPAATHPSTLLSVSFALAGGDWGTTRRNWEAREQCHEAT